MKSTKSLISDHETILSAVHILDEMVSEIESGREINHDDIRILLTFFREFADGVHHVKEEAVFFPALMLADRKLQKGPLRIMNDEHERGRALTAAMTAALDHDDTKDFLIYARRYINLLSDHIEKEHRVLFEIAERVLTDEEDENIADDFEQFENTIVGRLIQERLHSAIEILASKYLSAVAIGRG
jgi:hemerythrin-like domain-containing protein